MYVICKDCKKPAEVAKLKKGEGYFTKNLKDGCQCGTDQRRGESRQKWLIENMKSSLAELVHAPVEEQPEQKPNPKKESKPSKLWWLLIPVAGLGIFASKLLKAGSNR